MTMCFAGGSAGDLLLGGDGDDELYGGAGTDILDGGRGADRIEGGTGDDIMHGGAGGDTLDGGANRDTLSYETSDAGVTVDLRDSNSDGFHDTAAGGHAEGDSITNFEDVVGSAHADVLSGDGGANRLEGGVGNDRLTGGAGNDRLTGGAGNDRLTGGAGNDRLTGGAGNDRLTGGAGDDRLTGGAGDDTLVGGEGDDVYRFSGRRFGRDRIVDTGGNDIIEFSGVAREQLRFYRRNRDLVISVAGTKSQVTVKEWWNAPWRMDENRGRQVEAVRAGGYSLSAGAVSQLVQGMAGMRPSSSGSASQHTRPHHQGAAPLAAWQEIAGS